MRKQGGFSAGLVLAGCLIGCFMATEDAQAAPVNQTAPISRFTSVDEIVEACTTSTTFVNMPSMSRTFTLGGSTADQVVVTFQAAASLNDNGGPFDTGFVRLTIDGAAQGPADGLIPLIGVNERGTHGFTWQSKRLTVGSHTARIQWRTDLGSDFCVDARTLVILHR
jgi:hypothetical protein